MLEATIAILNADVITLDNRLKKTEAIAIYQNRIVAVGSNKEIMKYTGSKTKIIDAKNKTVLPGLVDCHAHMLGFGQHLRALGLRDAKSIKEIQRKLEEYESKNPDRAWIIGGRWDQEKLSEKRYPTRHDLDKAVKDKPVFLTRVCGHIAVVNTKALDITGITEKTKVPDGKVLLDEKTGKPNGILSENAMNLVWKNVPKLSTQELEEACKLACKNAVEQGLVCVHWIVGSPKEIRALQKLHSEEKLLLRVIIGIPIDDLDSLNDSGFVTGFGNDMLKIGFIKILADGSLGGQTAALDKPYADKPKTKGVMLYAQKHLEKLVMKAHAARQQLAIHAIGDRAIDNVLKAYEKALKEYPRESHRHRIEHCSVLNQKLIKRIKKSELIASVQPHFVASDFWVKDRVGGQRARWVYPFRSLLQEGIVLVSGSDSPVEPISPLLGLWAATSRSSFPEENLTLDQALRTYTISAAYASFDERIRGTIEPGKLADLTIISGDLTKMDSSKPPKLKVEMTIVDGRIVYATHQ